MGGCVSRGNPNGRQHSHGSSSQTLGSTSAPTITIGKNKPLANEKPKWKSEIPITIGQLRSKRDEYWETQPAFEGRREIWDALRAACETDDINLAQAIVNGANITLPTGSLTDAYDELGNRYVIPVYCISLPTNLIAEDSANSGSTSNVLDSPKGEALGEEIPIKIRLSTTNKDVKMNVRSGESVASLKRRINDELNVPANKQRLFFAGKLLYDKLTIGETKIAKGFVIQVIVSPDV